MEPGSSVHPGKDVEGDRNIKRHLEPLRNAVTKTRDLFERLSDPEAPSNGFQLAWNGILPSRMQEREKDRLRGLEGRVVTA